VAAYDYTNKKIVRAKIAEGPLPSRELITNYIVGNGAPFIVNDFHTKQADGLITYLQQTVIMQSLKGTPDRFLAQIAELVTQNEIALKDFGIIAWAPKLVDDYQKKDHVREVSARYERSSRYVGCVGDKITTDFTLIEKRYIKSMDCYVVYGHDAGDNLIMYWARNSEKVCEAGKISGRIKAHNEDEYRGDARVTVMNYVKVV
jgi:hypothetical protein